MRAGQGLQIPIKKADFSEIVKKSPEYARKEKKDTEHGGIMLSRKPIKNRNKHIHI